MLACSWRLPAIHEKRFLFFMYEISFNRIFQGCFTVQLSRFCLLFFVVVLFSATSIYYHTAKRLSTTFLKSFLCISPLFSQQLLYDTIMQIICQHFFSSFFNFFRVTMKSLTRVISVSDFVFCCLFETALL